MDFFQRAQNPWGQEVLVRISWDLFWASVIVGVLFMIGHLVLRRRLARQGTEASVDVSGAADVPERVERHSLTARLFHWVMAVAMLLLLITGFLPQVGIQFAWLTIHWVAGVVLILSIVFHIFHASIFQSLRNIWISWGDLKEWMQEVRHSLGRGGEEPPKPGKYPVDHKFFHHLVTLAGFVAMITGVLMLFRIDTPLWAKDPYMFSDATWGWIYVLHGLSGVILVTMVMAHIYFAILPEKRWITLSMIFGWIGRQQYLANHDPKRWAPGEAGSEKS